MGKTKQQKARKFDRNVEISAPILDPETIKAIHSPPKDKKLDIRHGGFKALLSDLNSQDSTDELVPIVENHLPSYIGISCAVSGYSNYSSYSRRPLEELNRSADTRASRLTTTGSRLSSAPAPASANNRSHTSSPTAAKQRACADQFPIHHVTIDKSAFSSADQERKELTEKLTASVTDRRRAPSPLPPLEDGRHHGAYVGARYFPMPEPSKQVHKHIPLLGIDDEQNPDEFVPEDTNKVEKQIANLYGEEFVEDWKESMSHKSKRELHHDDEGDDDDDGGGATTQQQQRASKRNPKDLVTLKPTPPRAPEPLAEPKEVETPDVKVLASVEKHFLNRLLSDENPPTPRTPSPQPPQSPRYSRPVVSPSAAATVAAVRTSTDDLVDSPVVSPPPARKAQRSPTPKQSPAMSPVAASPSSIAAASPSPQPSLVTREESPRDSPVLQAEKLIGLEDPKPREEEFLKDELITLDEQFNASLDEHKPNRIVAAELSPSPDSVNSSSTVEEAQSQQVTAAATSVEKQHSEKHIEYEIRAQSPLSNESSPVRMLPDEGATILDDGPESIIHFEQPQQEAVANLVSFSPEPAEVISSSESNNNNITTIEDDSTKTVEQIDLNKTTDGDILQPTPTETILEAPTTVGGGSNEEGCRDGRYFLSVLEEEESFIRDQIGQAEARLAKHEAEWDEETIGRVRAAIGKANLLINKKCNQFRELCEKSLVNDASDQYAVLNDDLAGFWDMISIQIADIRRSFEVL